MAGSFARNSLYSSIAGVCTALGGFICSIIVARVLGVESTGGIAFALWIATLTASVIDLGAQSSLARFIPDLSGRGEQRAAQALTRMLWWPVALASMLTLIGATSYAYWLHIHRDIGAFHSAASSNLQSLDWLIIGLICVLQAITGYVVGYLRGSQNFDRLARVTIIGFAFQIAAVLAGAIFFGLTGALTGYLVGAASIASQFFRIPRLRHALDPELRRRVIRYAAYAWGSGIITTIVWSRVEVLFLQWSWGNTSVGLFFVCLSFANLATQGPMLMTGGLLPYFSENYGQGNSANINKAFAAATRTLAFVVLPMCFGAAGIVSVMIPLIYGQAFADAAPAAAIIVAASAFGAVGTVSSSITFSAERADFGFYNALLGGVLSVVAGLTMIPAFGLFGAAWSRAIIQTLLVLIGFWFIHTRLRCPVPFAGLARIVIAAALCGIAAHLTLIAIPGYAGLASAILVGVVIYGIAARIFAAMAPEDAALLERFLQRLPSRPRAVALLVLRLLAPKRVA